MEYFVGAVLTLLVVVVTNKLIISQLKEEKKVVEMNEKPLKKIKCDIFI